MGLDDPYLVTLFLGPRFPESDAQNEASSPPYTFTISYCYLFLLESDSSLYPCVFTFTIFSRFLREKSGKGNESSDLPFLLIKLSSIHVVLPCCNHY